MLVAKRRDATHHCCYAAALAVREILLLILILQHRTDSFAPPTFVPTIITATIRIQSSSSSRQNFSRQHRHSRPPSFITTAALPEPGIVADVATINPIGVVNSARSWIMMMTAAGIPVVVAVLTQQQQQQQRNALMYQQNVTETELEQFQRRARGQDLRAKVRSVRMRVCGACWVVLCGCNGIWGVARCGATNKLSQRQSEPSIFSHGFRCSVLHSLPWGSMLQHVFSGSLPFRMEFGYMCVFSLAWLPTTYFTMLLFWFAAVVTYPSN